MILHTHTHSLTQTHIHTHIHTYRLREIYTYTWGEGTYELSFFTLKGHAETNYRSRIMHDV